jgi:23S rRNA (guanosine2251-2'-O)-methyltransferase
MTTHNNDANRQRDPQDNEVIFGRNTVLAFLEAEPEARRGVRGGRVNKIFAALGQHADKRLERIKQLARQRNIPVVECDRRKLDQMIGADQAHQGVVAQLSPVDYWQLDQFFQLVERDKEHFVAAGGTAQELMNSYAIGIVDGIEDPHNLGAIVRVAECAGMRALFVPERRSASLTAVVAKTSAGAIATLPIVRITNLVQTLERLKNFGFWIAGLDADAKESCFEADLARPLAVVIGSEGKGMSRLVKDNCDMLLRIPMYGKTESLNASVAAAVVFYEIVRQTRIAPTSKHSKKHGS